MKRGREGEREEKERNEKLFNGCGNKKEIWKSQQPCPQTAVEGCVTQGSW
jgi:hypothetical protein